MGKKKKWSSGRSWALLAAGFVAGAALVIVALKYPGLERPVPEQPRVSLPAPPEVMPPDAAMPPTEAPAEKPAPPPVSIKPPRPMLAIVIDDMGPDLGKLRDLLALGESVTVAVMPNTRYSREISREANSKGLDVIMHLPMEPMDLGGHNPGGDALLVTMTPEEIASRMEAGFRTVPEAVGLNNHMGSRFTADEERMRTVLRVVKKKEMFFLDSRTTADTVGLRLAKELRVRSAERNVFLDNKRDVGYIKGQLREAARVARKKGKAVAIGHPYPETIKALQEALPGLDVEVVRLSEIAE